MAASKTTPKSNDTIEFLDYSDLAVNGEPKRKQVEFRNITPLVGDGGGSQFHTVANSPLPDVGDTVGGLTVRDGDYIRVTDYADPDYGIWQYKFGEPYKDEDLPVPAITYGGNAITYGGNVITFTGA